METAYFITAIVSLATAVVTLWYHNNRREKKFNEQQSENLLRYHEASITMTNELAKNSKVIENNTKAHEKALPFMVGIVKQNFGNEGELVQVSANGSGNHVNGEPVNSRCNVKVDNIWGVLV